jgi:hypothetical protein
MIATRGGAVSCAPACLVLFAYRCSTKPSTTGGTSATASTTAVPSSALEPPAALGAGLYAWGVKGTNDCAAPSSRIVDAAACASAAAAAGKTYDGVFDNDAYPRGCAWCAPTRAHT